MDRARSTSRMATALRLTRQGRLREAVEAIRRRGGANEGGRPPRSPRASTHAVPAIEPTDAAMEPPLYQRDTSATRAARHRSARRPERPSRPLPPEPAPVATAPRRPPVPTDPARRPSPTGPDARRRRGGARRAGAGEAQPHRAGRHPRLRPLRPRRPGHRTSPAGGHAARRLAERGGLRHRHPDERPGRAARPAGRLPGAVRPGQQRRLLELVLPRRPAGRGRRAVDHRRDHPARRRRVRGRSGSGLRGRALGGWRDGRDHGRHLPGPGGRGRRALRGRLRRRAERCRCLLRDAQRRPPRPGRRRAVDRLPGRRRLHGEPGERRTPARRPAGGGRPARGRTPPAPSRSTSNRTGGRAPGPWSGPRTARCWPSAGWCTAPVTPGRAAAPRAPSPTRTARTPPPRWCASSPPTAGPDPTM